MYGCRALIRRAAGCDSRPNLIHMMEIAERESFRYTQTQKEDFLVAYLEHGKLSEACRQTGVGYEAAKAFKKQEWFQQGLNALRNERNAQLDAKLTVGLEKSLAAVIDRLENGEQRVTKSGEIVTIKAGLAAVTMATGVLYDKRALLRGEGHQTAPENILEQLADKLRLAVRKENAIDVQIKEVKIDSA